MRHSVLAAAVFGAMVATAGIVQAGEGMWVPQQLPEIAGPLKKAGLKLDPKQLANLTGDPMAAVVSLGGCTASFVSPQGLVVTNHHCAYGAIQLNSTPEKNLMQDGFNAATQADEVTAGPNARIYALDTIQDVTPQVQAAIAAAPDALGRTQALEKIEQFARRVPNVDAERNPATAHVFIINPLSGQGADNLFSTHPRTPNRVAALREIAAVMGSASPAFSSPTPSAAGGPWGRKPGPWG